jgi:hypothetical protein
MICIIVRVARIIEDVKMTFSPELYIVALKKWMVFICYWPQIWTHSVEIVRMLRYSVDEENVGAKKIEARSEA